MLGFHCTPKHVPCAGTGRAFFHHTPSSGSPLAPQTGTPFSEGSVVVQPQLRGGQAP